MDQKMTANGAFLGGLLSAWRAEQPFDGRRTIPETVEALLRPKKSRRMGPPDDGVDSLSPHQAAREMNCSRATIDRMAKDGTLPGVMRLRQGKRKGLYNISWRVLRAWMEEQAEGSTGAMKGKDNGKTKRTGWRAH
jgi:hypothetical protein